MLPAYKPGHIVIAFRGGRNVVAGDVVVLRHGGIEKIKRVHEVRGGRIYVVGDNQARSTDSRTFGWLHVSAVQGRVVWPRGN